MNASLPTKRCQQVSGGLPVKVAEKQNTWRHHIAAAGHWLHSHSWARLCCVFLVFVSVWLFFILLLLIVLLEEVVQLDYRRHYERVLGPPAFDKDGRLHK